METLKPHETLNQKLQTLALQSGANLLFEKGLFSVEFDDFEKLYSFLIFLYKQHYLLHGSSRLIDKLEPKQASCSIKQSGNLRAIYFTSNPDTALFCAICGGLGGFRSINAVGGYNSKNDRFEYKFPRFKFSGKPADFGYIYVIEKHHPQQLTNDDGEFIDEFAYFKAIYPKLIVKVKKEHFPFEIEKL